MHASFVAHAVASSSTSIVSEWPLLSVTVVVVTSPLSDVEIEPAFFLPHPSSATVVATATASSLGICSEYTPPLNSQEQAGPRVA